MSLSKDSQHQRTQLRYSIVTILCNSSAIILDLIPQHVYSVHYGKDSGMLFQFSMTMTISFLLFSITERNWYSKLLMGPIAAIASYALTFALMALIGLLDFRDMIKDLPGLFYTLVPFTLILLLYIWRSEKQKSQSA